VHAPQRIKPYGIDMISPQRALLPLANRTDALDYGLYLPAVWAAGSFGFAVNIFGPLFIIIPLACLPYAVLRQVVPPRILTAYVALCLLAGVLSHYRMFPPSWQTVFLDEAILRQLVPIVSFLALAWASKAYFRRRLRAQDVFAGEGIFLLLCFIVAPTVMLLADVRYEGDDSTTTVLAAFGTMINNIIIGLFFVMGRVFCTRGISRVVAIAVILLIGSTTHFVQFRLIAAATFLILLGLPARLVAIGVVAAFMFTYAITMADIPKAMAENPDKGIRVAFIADSFTSLNDTHMLGIGYGTESVRWTYRFQGLPDFTFMPDPRTITRDRLLMVLSRGVHNSFAQGLLRIGLPGALLLVAAFCAAFPAGNLSKPARSHASIMFVIIFTACFVDPGLESPVQLVGIGFVYGYLLALRAFAAGSPHVPRLRHLGGKAPIHDDNATIIDGSASTS
jgi:hypothetical protein